MRHPVFSSTLRMCSLSTSISLTLRLAAAEVRDGRARLSCGPSAHDHRAFDDVAQLADVAGPRVLLERAPCSRARSRRFACRRPRELVDEAPHEQRNVLGAFAQRRHAESETRSTGSRDLRGRSRRPIRCSRSRCVAAMMRVSTCIDFGLPSRSICRSSITRSSLTCTSRGSSPISSRKMRRAIRQLEATDLPGERAGEGALLPAEQLAFDERNRNRRAVDTDHRPAAARAQLVDLLGEELLPGARLAEEQHRGIGRRDLSNLFDRAGHGRTVADDEAGAESMARLPPEVQAVRLQRVPLRPDLREHGVERGLALAPRHVCVERGGHDAEAMHVFGKPPAFLAHGIEADQPENLSSAANGMVTAERVPCRR